jgi:hypothetical protein
MFRFNIKSTQKEMARACVLGLAELSEKGEEVNVLNLSGALYQIGFRFKPKDYSFIHKMLSIHFMKQDLLSTKGKALCGKTF